MKDTILKSPEFPRSSWLAIILSTSVALAASILSASSLEVSSQQSTSYAKGMAYVSLLSSILGLSFVVRLFWHLLANKKFSGTGPYALARLRANSPDFENEYLALLKDVETHQIADAESLERRISGFESIDTYLLQLHRSLRSQFVLIVLSSIGSVILCFASLYLGCMVMSPSIGPLSPEFLALAPANGVGERLLNALYCSSLIFATIGCGPTDSNILKVITILEILFSVATLSFTMGVTLSFYQSIPMLSGEKILRQAKLQASVLLKTNEP